MALTATSVYGVSTTINLTINNVATSIDMTLSSTTTDPNTPVNVPMTAFKVGYNGGAAAAITSLDEVDLVSSNTGVATISKTGTGADAHFVITPVAVGTTILTAYDASHKVQESALFTVSNVYPTSVSINPEKTTLNVAETETIQLLDSEGQAFVAESEIVSGIA